MLRVHIHTAQALWLRAATAAAAAAEYGTAVCIIVDTVIRGTECLLCLYLFLLVLVLIVVVVVLLLQVQRSRGIRCSRQHCCRLPQGAPV
jgi:hypothetical protein